jgi:hypothetical protein
MGRGSDRGGEEQVRYSRVVIVGAEEEEEGAYTLMVMMERLSAGCVQRNNKQIKSQTSETDKQREAYLRMH